MQQTLALFDEIPPVETLRTKREDQWFDRKSFRIKDHDLAADMIGFANADGGRIVVGIHNGEIEGVNSDIKHLNTLLQAAINYTVPPVRYLDAYVECVNKNGQPDRLLLLDIEASERIHRNQRDQSWLRIGDENRRLSMTEERELGFDKGEAKYDKSLVEEITLDDLDMVAIQEYASEYKVKSVDALMRTRGLWVETPYRRGVTQAAWLLFGKIPPIWSYVRYLRYDGTMAETGVRSNLIKDVRLEGTIPQLIEQAKALLTEEVKVIRLGSNGRFQTLPSLPEFAWLEAIVNAVTHRSYNLYGDGIRVKQFADRLVVESPGRLPGLVRVQNIRNSRFARNPHIARVLAETTEYVRESNEGVQRMFEEMEQSGLRPPEYTVTDSSVHVTLYKLLEQSQGLVNDAITDRLAFLRKRLGETQLSLLLNTLKTKRQISTHEIAIAIGVSNLTARNYMKQLEEVALVTRNKVARNDPTAVWMITEALFWDEATR